MNIEDFSTEQIIDELRRRMIKVAPANKPCRTCRGIHPGEPCPLAAPVLGDNAACRTCGDFHGGLPCPRLTIS